MVKMVRKTMMAMTHDGAETQMVAQRVETMVTVALSATTLTGSRWCRGIEKVGLDPLECTGPVCDLPAHTSCLLVGLPLLF